jgi:hypothetical protein
MMNSSVVQLFVVGGRIGGSAATLHAAQHSLRTAWIQQSETAKANRAKYIYNVDKMVRVRHSEASAPRKAPPRLCRRCLVSMMSVGWTIAE